MGSFNDLKKSRGTSSLDKINEKIKELNKSSENKGNDATYWKVSSDKVGNGMLLFDSCRRQ